MVENCLKGAGVELGRVEFIFLSPSLVADEWARAISTACVKADYSYYDGEVPGVDDEARRSVVVIRDVNQLPDWYAGGGVLLHLGLDTSIEYFGGGIPERSRDAVIDASRAFALLSQCRLSKVVDVAHCSSSSVDLFEGLGIEVPSFEPPFITDQRLEHWGYGAISMYSTNLPPSVGASARWGNELTISDPRGLRDSIEGALDMTGPPRSMVFGSDIWLPAGQWEAVIDFSLDGDGARHHFRMDWGVHGQATEFKVIPDKAGRYKARMVAEWDQPARSDLRMVLTEGCVSGYFTFHGSTVCRVG